MRLHEQHDGLRLLRGRASSALILAQNGYSVESIISHGARGERPGSDLRAPIGGETWDARQQPQEKARRDDAVEDMGAASVASIVAAGRHHDRIEPLKFDPVSARGPRRDTRALSRDAHTEMGA